MHTSNHPYINLIYCRQTFVDLVKKELDYDVTILPGKTEALCTFTGAVGALKQLEAKQINQPYDRKQLKYNIAIDIGGGRYDFSRSVLSRRYAGLIRIKTHF